MTKVSPTDLGLQTHTLSVNDWPVTIIRVLFELVGALAVVFIIIGGIQYVLSAGDSKKTAQAKNTILYALIGVAVAIFAGVIVTFLTGHL